MSIIEHNVKPGIHLCNQQDGTTGLGHAIMDFLQWFTNNELGRRSVGLLFRVSEQIVQFLGRKPEGAAPLDWLP